MTKSFPSNLDEAYSVVGRGRVSGVSRENSCGKLDFSKKKLDISIYDIYNLYINYMGVSYGEKNGVYYSRPYSLGCVSGYSGPFWFVCFKPGRDAVSISQSVSGRCYKTYTSEYERSTDIVQNRLVAVGLDLGAISEQTTFLVPFGNFWRTVP